VRLALTPTTPKTFADYRDGDRRFPYHPTPLQWFGHDRFEHYRALGYHNALGAIAGVKALDGA
jgi:hypothetical protein